MSPAVTSTADTPKPAAGGADVSDAELVIRTDTRSPIRLGFWVLIVGFGLFVLWASLAPLDEGVAAQATVSIETRRKTIQHLQGGIIQALPAREAQTVQQGDVLLVLDDGVNRAAFEAARQNYLMQRALESRLMAELADQSTIAFHPDLAKPGDGVAAQHMRVQQQLFEARRAAQRAEIAAAEQSIVGVQGQIAGIERMLQSKRGQSEVQARQLGNVSVLAGEGFAPRNQALQLEQMQAELKSSMAELETSIQRSHSAIAETRLRIAQRKQEFLKEVSAQLADVRREVQANQERLAAVSAELGRTQIRAPVSGQVVGLMTAGIGSVVTPGQRLMDIVPVGEGLLLDAKIPPSVIDRVKAGIPVEVRFTAFANSPQLVVHGRVVSLGGDALTEQIGSTVINYYLARVEVTKEGLKALGDRVLQPGMQAEVLLKTGERTLLAYLLHPLSKRIAAAMTEE
jgi:protease secretion system membrane fusion protein